MRKVHNNLYVGSSEDYDRNKGKPGWAYILAAKEPYHRDALKYTTLAAPKDNPEYLIAKRGQRLILNLVDVPREKSKFIPDEIINRAIIFINSQINIGEKVLVVSSTGKSRSPAIAFAYLIRYTNVFDETKTFSAAEKKFKEIYHSYDPNGIRDKVEEIFDSTR